MNLSQPLPLASPITAATSSGGLIKITCANHGLLTGYRVHIGGVLGTLEANGMWTITKIDNNNFTLNSSAFVNTYTSGGVVWLWESIVVVPLTSPGASGCDVAVSYKLLQNATVVGVKTDAYRVINASGTIVLNNSPTLSMRLESLDLFNNSAATIVYTVVRRLHTGVDQSWLRVSLAVNERFELSGSKPASVYQSNGKLVDSAQPPEAP